MQNKHRPGFTFAETLIVGALFGVFVLAASLLLSIERAKTRDAIRIADMTRVAAAFAVLHAQSASYSGAAEGCGAIGDPVTACSFAGDLTGLGTLQDPGKFKYTVSRVPDRDDFGITFHLERSYQSLAAGQHTLTKTGIR